MHQARVRLSVPFQVAELVAPGETTLGDALERVPCRPAGQERDRVIERAAVRFEVMGQLVGHRPAGHESC